jgi:glycosyltransferase involved in cell wall biosynthesis
MFSIVIPLYNKEHRIVETIKSVLKQTLDEYELIIVNDGSTDRSLEVIEQFKKNDKVKIVDQENQGVSVARNNGVINAQYDYVAFLDADDEWEPTYLEKMKEVVSKFPNAGMYCSAGYYKDVKTGCITTRICKRYENKILKVKYFENPHVFTHTSATIVSKKIFNEVPGGFPKGMKKNEDLVLFYSLALISNVVYSGFPLSYYCSNVDNQATQIHKKAYGQVCSRLNLTFSFWDLLGRKDEFFATFMKYEIRHLFLYYIKENNYGAIKVHLDLLDEKLLSMFPNYEMTLLKSKILKPISIIYLLMSKIIWRMNGFPRVTTPETVRNCE